MDELLYSFKKTPIANSETKLKQNNLYNIALQDYIFLESNSKTSAGGVAFYVDKDVAFAQRTDLELNLDGLESCWIEIENKKQKNIVIGCI